MVAGTRVITVKGEKRSDFGCVSSPVWAGTADESYVRHEREFKNDSQGGGQSSWKHGAAVAELGRGGMASGDWQAGRQELAFAHICSEMLLD